MATMNSTIAYIDSVKPNVFEEETKYNWLNRLEGMISVEVHGDAEPAQYDLPADADTELLVPHPYDDIYALYVGAMIDFYNKEYNNYNNSMLMFQERLEAYKRWYIQRHAYGKKRNFRNVWG